MNILSSSKVKIKSINKLTVGIVNEKKHISLIIFLIKNEPENGISHLLEHVIARELFSFTEKYGCEFKAETSFDYTLFQVYSFGRFSESFLSKLYKKIFSFKFNKKDFIKEKNVVIEEIKKNEENPYSFIGEQLYKLTRNSTVLGEINYIKNIKLNSIKNFYKNFYRKGNTIIVTNNDKNIVEKFLKIIPDGKKEIKRIYNPKLIKIKKENIPRNYFLLEFPTFNFNFYKLFLLSKIIYSEILRKLCKKQATLYDFSSWVNISDNTLCIDFSSFKNFEINRKNIIKLIYNLPKYVDNKTISKIKKKAITDFVLSMEDIRKNLYKLTFFIKNDQLKNFLDFKPIFNFNNTDLATIINKLKKIRGSQIILQR